MGGEGAGLGTVGCGVVSLNVFVNNSLGLLPLLHAGVVGGWRARLGQGLAPLQGEVGWSKLGSFLLHIYVKLNSSNSSGNNAQQIVLGKIK